MKILSIDGGGIRGIIPAMVLAEIEARAQKPAAELFDLIAGTSTGGILAAALASPDQNGNPRWAAAELVDLYRTEGPHIFRRSLWRIVSSTRAPTTASKWCWSGRATRWTTRAPGTSSSSRIRRAR